MNYCEKCSVSVHSQHKKCPLCDATLLTSTVKEKSISRYPEYPLKKRDFFDILMSRWALVISIVAILICGMVNIFTFSKTVWSLIVAGSIIYEWITIKHTVKSKSRFGKKLIIQVISISGLCLLIDWVTGLNKWAGNYIIPFVVIGVTFTLTLLAMLRSEEWVDNFGHLMVLLFISIVPLLFFFLGVSNVLWTTISAILYAVITIIILIVFAYPKLKEELKKRFHIKQ